MRRPVSALLVLALITAGCTGNEAGRPVPRRYAYPRAAALPDSTITCTVGGAVFEINKSARISSPHAGWLDARYPAFGATLHLSVTEPENMPEAIGNRRERISLNLRDAVSRTSTFTTPTGYLCELVSTAEGPVTPVQFIASHPGGAFVCGTFVLAGSTEPADSLRPIVSGLENEAISIMNSLR